MANLADTAIPIDTVTSYDPAGRAVKVATVNNGAATALREVLTSYSGRTVTSFAPDAAGSTTPKYGATRTTTDAYGQVIRTEKALQPGAAFTTVDKTETRYNLRGDVVSITDDADKVTARAKGVDSRGRLTKSSVQLESSTTPGAVNLNTASANDDSLFIEYIFENAFTRNDQVWKQILPSVGTTFTQETLTTAFTSLGLANTLKTDDPFGAQIGGSGPRYWVTKTGYDPYGRIITRRLASAQTSGAPTLITLM